MKSKDKISQETKLLIDNKVKIIMTKIIDIDTDENTNLDNKDFLKLIYSNIESIKNTIYILHLLSKEILFKENANTKIKIFELFSEFFSLLNVENKNSNNIINKYFKYSSVILAIIQKMILLDIPKDNFKKIFGNMVIKLFDNKLMNEIRLKQIKKYFIIFQGFCFYNMKQNQYKNQIIGILCLKELITKTDFYIQNKKFIKNIIEKIIIFLDNNNFEPKCELFDLLYIFIQKCDKLYEPYINITLYKLLNYIEINNIDIKRKIIDVLSIIISNYSHEFQNISNYIINFLNNLIINNQKDLYIKNKCQETLV